jgi:hypothetical protein
MVGIWIEGLVAPYQTDTYAIQGEADGTFVKVG